jgi:hypothetical protein
MAQLLGQLGVFLTLGFGRTATSETEAPNMVASVEMEEAGGGTKRQCDRRFRAGGTEYVK